MNAISDFGRYDFRRADPANNDYARLVAWCNQHSLPDDRSGGEPLAWAKRGLRQRAAEWAWEIHRGRRSAIERANRSYDLMTMEVMRQVLRPDSNCLDIGAANGEILRVIRVLASRGRHHAFEPIPYQAQKLRKRFSDVEIHEVALSDENGEVDFFVVRDDPFISSLQDPEMIRGLVGDTRISDWEGQIEKIRVASRRLDDESQKMGRIDFIKIDVEGAEVAVLRGALRLLAKDKPTVIFEYSGEVVENLYGRTDLLDTFSEAGLTVSSLEGWISNEPPLGPSTFPSKDARTGVWNWMYVAHA